MMAKLLTLNHKRGLKWKSFADKELFCELMNAKFEEIELDDD